MLSATHAMPRSSSPLNPRSSSPPPSSPTPGGYSSPSHSRLPAFGRSNTTPLSARYARTTPSSSLAQRRPSRIPSSPGDFFSGDTTPTESAMWRDKFARRLADTQRRRSARDRDLARRRGTEPLSDDVDAEQRAIEEDEEIFRRLMILQQRKAQHAALVSYEQETGGSDPLLPEFWEEDLSAMEREEMALLQEIEMAEAAEAERAAEVLETQAGQGARDQAMRDEEDEKMRALEQCGEYEEWQYGYDDWENGLEEFDEAELAELEAAAKAAKGDSMDVD